MQIINKVSVIAYLNNCSENNLFKKIKAGKRKRGKLNLEKAMSKNIFEENNKSTNLSIFDQFTTNSKNNPHQVN